MIFQEQLSEGKFALLSCEELLEFANKTLTITDEEEFLKVGRIESGFHVLLQKSLIPDSSFPGCQTDQRTVCDASALTSLVFISSLTIHSC